MKNKFLLLVLSVCLSVQMYGQSSVLVFQNFEGSLAGWTASPGAPSWTVNTYTGFNNANFTIPAPPVPSEPVVAAVYGNAGGTQLMAPVVNATGFDSVEVWFDYYLQAGTGNVFEFAYSNDGATIHDFFILPTTPAWQRVYVTIPAASLTGTMYFIFYYEGGAQGGLAIDNFSVIGYKSIPNVTCANATTLTPNATCVPTTATIELNSGSGGASACYPTITNVNSDTWFQFTATSSIHKITAGNTDLSDFDLIMEIYSGSCGNLNLIQCVDLDDVGDPQGTGVEEFVYGNFVIGQTYYVRLYNYYLSSYPAAVNICVEAFTSCNLTQPAGSTLETEACGLSINEGCNLLPATPVYQDISCGETIWGTTYAENGSRDTDWYRFTITNPTTVTWTVESEVPVNLLFVDISNCSAPGVLANVAATSCQSTVLTHNFTTAGTYVAFIAPQFYEGFSCTDPNTNYIATLTYTTPTPTITAGGATTFCNGGSVVLSATGTGTYQWYDGTTAITGATSSTYTATAAGNYNVIVTNGSCASAPSNIIAVTISTPAAPTVAAGGPVTFCQGGSVVLTATGSGTSFQWYNGTTAITGATSSTYTATTAGSYTVEEIVGGCTSAQSSATTVTVNPLDDASFTYSPSTVCAGAANTTPTVTTAGGTFTSNPNTLVFADASTGEIDVAASPNGSFTVTYTTAGTCPNSSNSTFTITSAPDASFSYANASYCANGTNNPLPVFTTGSAGVFSAASGLTINSSTGEVTLATSMPGQYTVTNTIAASGSCPAASATAPIEILESPTATVSGGGSICGSSTATVTVTLTGTSPWDFELSDGSNTIPVTNHTGATYTYTATTAGTYTVTNLSDDNCTGTISGSAIVTSGVGYTIQNDQTICPGGNYQINGKTYTLAGTYRDTVLASDGCDSVIVTNLAITNINIGVTKAGFTLTASQAGAMYEWIDCATNTPVAGATSQSFTPSTNGQYKVKITVGTCTETSTCTDVQGISINEAFATHVNVFPNPSSDYVTVQTGSFTMDRIAIVNIEGRILSEVNVNANAATVDLTMLNEGMYFLYIYSSENMVIKKLIKK